jgi:hypothetical protein
MVVCQPFEFKKGPTKAKLKIYKLLVQTIEQFCLSSIVIHDMLSGESKGLDSSLPPPALITSAFSRAK